MYPEVEKALAQADASIADMERQREELTRKLIEDARNAEAALQPAWEVLTGQRQAELRRRQSHDHDHAAAQAQHRQRAADEAAQRKKFDDELQATKAALLAVSDKLQAVA
jgi:hypothetical protein